MLRAKWCFLALVLPLIGAGTASAEGSRDGWGNNPPVYYGDQQYYKDGQTFSPERGVTCDQSHSVCFDNEGFNKAKTERYFGKQAAILAERNYGDRDFDNGYAGNWNGGNWNNGNWNNGGYSGLSSPRKGVFCSERAKVCTNRSGIDLGWTGEVFGNRAKNTAREWMRRPSFSPMRNVVCDNSRKVCFDRRRPSAELTKLFYGRRAVKDSAWWN